MLSHIIMWLMNYNLRSMNEVKWINKYIKMVLLVLHSTVEKRKNNMNEFENVVLCYDASSVGT